MKSGLRPRCRCRPEQNCHSSCIVFFINFWISFTTISIFLKSLPSTGYFSNTSSSSVTIISTVHPKPQLVISQTQPVHPYLLFRPPTTTPHSTTYLSNSTASSMKLFVLSRSQDPCTSRRNAGELCTSCSIILHPTSMHSRGGVGQFPTSPSVFAVQMSKVHMQMQGEWPCPDEQMKEGHEQQQEQH